MSETEYEKELFKMVTELKQKYPILARNIKVACEDPADDISEIIEVLKEKNEEIDKLKKQLAEAFLPKFKVGQEVYIIIDDEIKGGKKVLKDLIVYFEFRNGRFEYWTNYWGARVPLGKAEKDLFTTKEEAEKRLEELD